MNGEMPVIGGLIDHMVELLLASERESQLNCAFDKIKIIFKKPCIIEISCFLQVLFQCKTRELWGGKQPSSSNWNHLKPSILLRLGGLEVQIPLPYANVVLRELFYYCVS